MTDRTPDDDAIGADEIDEELDLGTLRDLGFDALSDDAPLDGIDDVRARAARSARRRGLTVGAAVAAMLLVVGTLGVVLARTGEESAPDVRTGPAWSSDGQHFLLPPADATDVGFGISGYDVQGLDLDVIDPGPCPSTSSSTGSATVPCSVWASR